MKAMPKSEKTLGVHSGKPSATEIQKSESHRVTSESTEDSSEDLLYIEDSLDLLIYELFRTKGVRTSWKKCVDLLIESRISSFLNGASLSPSGKLALVYDEISTRV